MSNDIFFPVKTRVRDAPAAAKRGMSEAGGKEDAFSMTALDETTAAFESSSLQGFSRVNNLRSTKTRLERKKVSIYCATFNVGNQPMNETFYTEFLKKSEGCDVVVIAAQEASYAYSRKILQPADFARLAEKKVENDSVVNKKEKKTFWGSSKATKMVATLSGGITGGVATGPLAPVGFVVGMVGGYYGGKKIAEESKCRQHWFASVEACLKPTNNNHTNNKKESEDEKDNDEKNEYVLVQSDVLMQMRLSVHCKKYLEKSVKRVTVGVKATGMGNVVGNKGGIMVEIQFYGGESIAFLGCHLAAHEEKKFYARRLETIRAIIGCAWRDRIEKPFGCEGNGASWEHSIKAVAEASGLMSGDRNSNINKSDNNSNSSDNAQREVDEEEQKKRRRLPPDLELLESATHTFFMGDLNFRIDPGPTQAYETPQINNASEMVGADDDDENSVWNSCWSKADIVTDTSVNRRAKLPGEIESADEDSESDSQVNTTRRENIPSGGTSQSSPFHVGWKFIADTIKQKNWGRLWIGDQLLHAQRQGKCLFGFQELPLQFPPSFKRDSHAALKGRNNDNPVVATEEYYSKKRIPSYTDRVLIKSLPGFEATRKAHTYEACHGVTSSDHAPVCATFSLSLLLGTSEHDDANDDVLPVQNEDDYFARLTVEKLQLETHDDRLIFASIEEQNASLLKVHLGKLRTNALEVDDFETADGSRWSNAKSISNVVLIPSRSFAKDEVEDGEENMRARSRSSCVWNSRTLRRVGDDTLDPDVLPVLKLPKKRAELQNAPYYVIFTVVNERTNARIGTAIMSVPTDGKRLPFEADCTSRGRVVGKLRGEWAIELKDT